MNDYETIMAMLARAKIQPREFDAPLRSERVSRDGSIALEANSGGVEGYSGFQTLMHFRADGSLRMIEIFE